MKPFRISAPARVDLAGGTLDIWPLSAMVPGAATFNCTLSDGITLDIHPVEGATILENATTGISREWPAEHVDLHILTAPIGQLAPDLQTGWHITLSTGIPRGSGLGTSSVILAAMLTALDHIRGTETDPYDKVAIASDIEARIIGVPTGIQDYVAPVFGGLSEITFPPGGFHVNHHPVPKSLTRDAILVFTGIHHFSGAPNWEVLKLMVEQPDKRTVLEQLVAVTKQVRSALKQDDMEILGNAMRTDYEIRKTLPVQLVPDCPDLFRLLESEPDICGFRMCGAAGGGCVLALARPGKRPDVVARITSLGYRVLDLVPSDRRLSLDTQ